MRILSVLIIMLVSGCVSNVLFYETVHSQTPSDSHYKIYMDGYGDIYGPEDIGVFHTKSTSAWLRCAYYRHACMGKAPPLDLYTNGGERRFQPDEQGLAWRREQEGRLSKAAIDIVRLSEGSSRQRPIIFLIHGFRVPSADFEYSVARARIDHILGEDYDPLFVEVHWDGRKSHPIAAAKAWKQAQFSAPMVGLRLRYLMNKVDERHRQDYSQNSTIRVLTHSSGAIVAGSLIGDAGAALPCFNGASCGSVYLEFEEKRAKRYDGADFYGVPQVADLRVAMMAAATPSTTFVGSSHGQNQGKGVLTRSGQTTLIVGHNNADIALNKVIGQARLFGDSSLGKSVLSYCNIENTIGEEIETYIVNMKRPVSGWLARTKHDFSVYLNDTGSRKMIELLFDTARHDSDFVC